MRTRHDHPWLALRLANVLLIAFFVVAWATTGATAALAGLALLAVVDGMIIWRWIED